MARPLWRQERRIMKNNKYYIVMCDMLIPVQAPDGGIWSDHEEAEYSGVIHTSWKDAADEMKQAIIKTKNDYSIGSFWIKEMEN